MLSLLSQTEKKITEKNGNSVTNKTVYFSTLR